MNEIKTTGVGFIALFFSIGTLLCCVLPIVLVSLGLGAAIAALIGAFPIIATFSQYKAWIFLISALFLAFTAWLIWRPSRACPMDPKLALLCNRFQNWDKRIFWVAFVLWLIGTGVTYVILPLVIWLGR